MDLQSSIEFAGALIVVVGAGIALGMALRPRRHESIEGLQARKTILYAEIVMGMDNLSNSSAEHKQYFIQRYYQALIYAPDSVVRSLNAYLEAVAQTTDSDKLIAARDAAVLAMRRDVAKQIGKATTLKNSELQTVEIEHHATKSKENPLTKKSS